MFRTILAAAVVVGSSVSAQAAVMQAVYSGVTFQAYDITDVFGLGMGTDISGVGYTLTINYDTEIGRVTDMSGSTIVRDYVAGGTAAGGLPPPIISAVLKIGSMIVNSSGNYLGQVELASMIYNHYADQLDPDPVDPASYVRHLFSDSLVALTGLDPVNLETPLVLTRDLSSYGNFEVSGQFTVQNYDSGTQSFVVNSFGYLQATRLEISVVDDTDPAPVPLPASALLLLAGLGGLVVARRRGSR